MDADFWEKRWKAGQIGFHLSEVNPLLAKHHRILPSRGRVLVPLCGKSLDLVWLARKGHDVAGVELVEQAIDDFFREQALPFDVDGGPPPRFTSGALTLVCSDILKLDKKDVGRIEGVWDRAALVALPAEVRPLYASALRKLAPGATLLLVTFVHDLGSGPPFSVSDDEVRALFGAGNVALIDQQDGTPSPTMQAQGMKSLREHAWRIDLPAA